MDTLHKLALGLVAAGSPSHLLYALGGCVLGLLLVLRSGMGPVATMAVLLPLSYALAPLPGLLLLLGTCYGTHYGGSRAAVLGGLAAGTAATLVLALCGPWLSALALGLGPVERCTLLLLLLLAVLWSAGPPLKGLGMLLLGLLLGLVGRDGQSGLLRFTLEVAELDDGLGLAALTLGLFGSAEIIRTLGRSEPARVRLADRASGVWSGNARVQVACLPLLALGLPVNASMALLLGALARHRVPTGAPLLDGSPELFWALLAGLWLGNLILVLLNLPLLQLRGRVLRLPLRWLYPAFLLLGALGIYSIGLRSFDLWLLAACGLAGYGLHQLGLAPAPLLLGFVLGPALEHSLRQALAFSGGDWSVFLTRPLSAGMLASGLGLVLALLPHWRSKLLALVRR